MPSLNDTLYFHNIRLDNDSAYRRDWWSALAEEAGPGGQFYINISKRFSKNRFVTRNGEWSLPWPQDLIPGYEMPVYDPNFSKTFGEVSDEKGQEIKKRVQNGERFAVMYSGGIDSTVILVSVLKNLSDEELKSIVVCSSVHSLIENPLLWKTKVQGKIKIIDTQQIWYDDIIAQGYTPITGDEGDCIFGTIIGTEMYHNFDYHLSKMSPTVRENLKPYKHLISSPSVHYSVYKDMIINHLSYDKTPEGKEFGRRLYEKYHHNIETTTNACPIVSLHDFFWWLIFNVKYLNCSVRGAIYFNTKLPVEQCIKSIENWFNDKQYQLWSMANNNNGQKIGKTLSSYKLAAREYIRDFDKNDYYYYFKTKLESLGNLNVKKKVKQMPGDAIDSNFNRWDLEEPDVQDYFRHHIMNYKLDWTD